MGNFQVWLLACRKDNASEFRAEVLGMLGDDEDGLGEMMVEVEWRDCTMGVPLAQIKGIGVNEKTAEAIADWHYWVVQGRQF